MRVLCLMLFVSGCSTPGAFTSSPSQPPHIQLYHHAVRYALLGHVSAKACAQDDEFKAIRRTRSPDPRAVGPGYLFEMAKYDALEKMPTADGLFSIRAKVEVFENGECITLAGLAYRILHVAAVTSADDYEEPESDQSDDEHPKQTAPNDQL
jgi:hypothetical protein